MELRHAAKYEMGKAVMSGDVVPICSGFRRHRLFLHCFTCEYGHYVVFYSDVLLRQPDKVDSLRNHLNVYTTVTKSTTAALVDYCIHKWSSWISTLTKQAYPDQCCLNSKRPSASISIVDVHVCSRSLLNCFLNRFLCA